MQRSSSKSHVKPFGLQAEHTILTTGLVNLLVRVHAHAQRNARFSEYDADAGVEEHTLVWNKSNL